ncbi:hypothetical protein CABS01_02070 [Colletotrichum abscissum]|uniref:Uncharacterized protein n=1 Tax=Colletotrichum abscissum TaxID=1671311 RepID=A0A9P9WZT5_9PEZI|nr:uncharacterized protein CABS01_02070 [Colletotrichum abscissum]KAI3528321.1 hypothetical protein CABS02_15147 [Colletotrichum abscissum]KAK1488440.1 hypothetical protein CABS01_02070 [Colletotrichum abscissum]
MTTETIRYLKDQADPRDKGEYLNRAEVNNLFSTFNNGQTDIRVRTYGGSHYEGIFGSKGPEDYHASINTQRDECQSNEVESANDADDPPCIASIDVFWRKAIHRYFMIVNLERVEREQQRR